MAQRKHDYSTPTAWAPWYSGAQDAAPQNRAAAACEAALAEATRKLAECGKPDAWQWFSVLFDAVDGTPTLQPTREANQILGDGTAERYAAEIASVMRAAFDAGGPERGQPNLLEISGKAREYLQYVHRTKKVGQRGGQAPKLRGGIYDATLGVLRESPVPLSARAVWNRIPQQDGHERRSPIMAAGFEVYRAWVDKPDRAGRTRPVECVCQVNGPNADGEIEFTAFRRYVTRARKQLRSK